MRIAVEGCSHGCLDQIYSTILALDRKAGKKTALLLLCGDVQTVRNPKDLHCLAVPDKYKQMGDFHRYYSGERKAPILTLMIGGNHEASNYLWELYHGGWVAPNIYYIGAAGCVNVGGLNIAGISGIYKSHDYTLGRFESMPYNHSTVRSIYHTRQYDTFRLHQMSRISSRKPDIVMSHDWPNTIEQHGDVNWLKKRKPFFVDEIKTSSLGSPPLWKLLLDLCPKFWFSAHLHVRFAALYKHSGEATQLNGGQQQGQAHVAADGPADLGELIDESVETKKGNVEELNIEMSDAEENIKEEGPANPEVIDIDDDDLDEDPPVSQHNHTHNGTSANDIENHAETSRESGTTKFLALSKCLQGQDFLQILDIPAPFDDQESYQRDLPSSEGEETSSTKQPSFQYSIPWMAVTKATHEYLSLEKRQRQLPEDLDFSSQVKEQEKWVIQRVADLQEQGKTLNILDIERTQQFVKTAPASNDQDGHQGGGPPPWYTNPQTVALCSFLEIENKINPPPPVSSAPPLQFSAGLPNGLPQRPLVSEEEEIRRIEEAAQTAMKRKRIQQGRQEDEPSSEVMTRLDDELESNSRWKEGSG